MLKRVPLALVLCSSFVSAQVSADKTAGVTPPVVVEAEERSPFEWVGAVTPIQRTIAQALRESRRTAPGATGPLLQRIVDLGPTAVDGCFTILLQGRVPKSAPDDAPQKLSVPQRELVLAALAQLPAKDVRKSLERLAAEQLDPSRARAAIEVFGVVGTAKDVRRLAPLCARDESGALDYDDKLVLRAAYVKILARDESAFTELAALVTGKDTDVAQQVLMAFGERSEARALQVAFEAVRSRPALAQTAVSLLPRFASSIDAELRDEVDAWLRSATDAKRIEWTRAVYGALAVFDEGEAMNELLDALDSEETPLRSAALSALRSISSTQLPPDASRWRAWYEAERAWFDSDRPRLGAKLRDADAATVVEGLKEYATHSLWKSTLTADLEPLLDRREPELRALACRELGRLGSVAAVPRLTSALEDPVPDVARAADEALRLILKTPAPVLRPPAPPVPDSDP